MKAILDSNIFISALVFPGGRAFDALAMASKKKYELLLSPAILTEVADVLQRKFHWEKERVSLAFQDFVGIAENLKPPIHISLLKDEPDNRILECAVAGCADVIVTGDKAILALKKFQGIPIVSLTDFVDSFR